MSIPSQSGYYSPAVYSQSTQSSTRPQATQSSQADSTQADAPASGQGSLIPNIVQLMLQLVQLTTQSLNPQAQPQQAATPDYTDNSVVEQQLQQLTNGDPQLNGFITEMVNMDPESPELQQKEARLSAFWKGSPDDLQKIFQLIALHQVNNVEGSVNAVLTNLDPSSPEAQQQQVRIASLNNIRDTLIQKLQTPQG